MAEKSKKIDRFFKLSDSSVNCYGFRLLTEGYQLANYQVNPIGYYMHGRENGVVVKWEDLKVEDGAVFGKPVINLINARGQQTLEEIENGFLNGASMGDFVVLDYSIDEADMLPGQTGPTVKSWYNKECSIVDLPGNNNALVQLFDQNNNVLKLADLMAGSKNEVHTLNFNMKQVTLNFTASWYASLGLAAAATPAQIEEKLNALFAKADQYDQLAIDVETHKTESKNWKLKYENLQTSSVKTQLEGMLDKAIEDKKITVATKAQLGLAFASNPEGLKTLLAGMTGYQVITDALVDGDATAPKGMENKTWDELFRENKLDGLKVSNLAYFKKLFKDKYGKDYE